MENGYRIPTAAEKAIPGIYRVPILGDRGLGDVVIEPNPFGDPHTVKVTLPWPENAWAILPRTMFSKEVNERTRMVMVGA